MWHEARKQEKKIRGMIVDYRKRADRRKEFYERIRADPTQFLQLHGRKCKIHFEVSDLTDSESYMMKWQGQTDNLIDRFDVRAHLDYIPSVKKDEAEAPVTSEERQTNYERFRILAQNEFLGITEENFLKQLQLEEQFGVNAHQMDNNKDKKKNSQLTAAIGFIYEDSTTTTIVPFSQTISNIESGSSTNRLDEFSKDYSDESDGDMDVAIDINKIGTQEAIDINKIGTHYGMQTNDFFSYLTKDEDEKQSMKVMKELEADKAQNLGGRRSRRERRSQREKRILGKPMSPPSYAAKEEKTKAFEEEEEDEKSSRENSRTPSPEKITYITSFGGEDELKPHPKISITLNKPMLRPGTSRMFSSTYADKVKKNLEQLKKINDVEKGKLDSRRRSRSSSRRRRDSSPRSRRRHDSSRSTSRSRRRRHSSRSSDSTRRRRTYSSRSRSSSRRWTRSSRSYSPSSYSYVSRSPSINSARQISSSIKEAYRVKNSQNRKKSSSRDHSQSCYSRGTRDTSWSRRRSTSREHSYSPRRSLSRKRSTSRKQTESRKRSPSKKKSLSLKRSASRKRSSRSKKRSTSRKRRSYSSSSSSSSTSSSVSSSTKTSVYTITSASPEKKPNVKLLPVATIVKPPGKSIPALQPAPVRVTVAPVVVVSEAEADAPVKRYYGRKRDDASSSPSPYTDETESDNDTKRSVAKPSSTNDAAKLKSFNRSADFKVGLPKSTVGGPTVSNPREKLKKKMQLLLNKQYKADKKAETERIERQMQMQQERDEEMRELALKLRRKQRELRHRYGDTNDSKSESESDAEGKPTRKKKRASSSSSSSPSSCTTRSSSHERSKRRKKSSISRSPVKYSRRSRSKSSGRDKPRHHSKSRSRDHRR